VIDEHTTSIDLCSAASLSDMDRTTPTDPETGDAFGRALEAHHAGEDAHEIIEREDGYLDPIDVVTYFSEYEEWSPHIQTALEHVTGSVLDVGCGAGRFGLHLHGGKEKANDFSRGMNLTIHYSNHER
jgi:SAM-dependent methyltransferase